MAEGGKSAKDVFKKTVPKIIGTLGQQPPFTFVITSLLAEDLITDEEREHIEAKPSPAEKGNEIIKRLQKKIKGSDDPVQCLLKICDVFESEEVNDETLKKHGASMRKEVSSTGTSTAASTVLTNQATPAHTVSPGIDTKSTIQEPQGEHGVEDTDSAGTTQEPQGENDDKNTDSAVEPPEWTDNAIKYEKEDVPFSDDLTQDIKFLLMPATPAEEKQVLLYLEPKDESSDKYIKTSVNDITLYIGKYGKTPVIVVMTAPAKDRQGPTQAAIIATTILTTIKSIEYVVAVGVCFGIDKKKQQLGDVVISSIICDFVCNREGTTVSPRGPQDGVGDKILNIFKPSHNFKMLHEKNVHIGPVISTSNVIDNEIVKARLVKFRPDAVGGEMEGSAINAAVKKKLSATCIVIKGIGDWGDGNKEGSKGWKPYAARAAAYYVKTALNEFCSD